MSERQKRPGTRQRKLFKRFAHTGVTSRHRSKRTDKVITASITTDAQNDGAGDTVVTSVATSTAHATPIEVRWGESAWANAMPMR